MDGSLKSSTAHASKLPPTSTGVAEVVTPRYFHSELQLLPGIHLPLRSMIIPTTRGKIVISPLVTAREAEEASGEVAAVVAPSVLHNLYLQKAIDLYHPVAVWVPPGLAERKPKIDLNSAQIFGRDVWPYADEVEVLVVRGAKKRNEILFFHQASRTVYTADLFFNVQSPEGVLAPLAFRLMGIYKCFAMSSMWKFWVDDREAFLDSMHHLLRWDFDRLVVAHGEIIERGAHRLVAEALAKQGFLPLQDMR